MKVLNRKEFLNMPEGTIFAKGEPWHFNQIAHKAETMGADFVYMSLANIDSYDSGEWSFRLNEMLETGASYPIDNDGFMRDGLFDEDDVFLVFERDDLIKLRGRINEAIAVFDEQPAITEE